MDIIETLHFVFSQGAITNILEENVVQPLLVSMSAIDLAAETVRSILKIDDIVSTFIISYLIYSFGNCR